MAAPGVGVGAGLSGTAKGITDVATSFGGIVQGFKDLFALAPFDPNAKPPGYGDILAAKAGNDQTQLLSGGGGNVPTSYKAAGVGVGLGGSVIRTVTVDNSAGGTTMPTNAGGNAPGRVTR